MTKTCLMDQNNSLRLLSRIDSKKKELEKVPFFNP